MAQVFLGSLMLVPYNFAPLGFLLCQGQLLPISQFTALFSLLGTTYGGDGKSTFALPDLRGRVPISAGQGPGLQSYDLGQNGGEETVALILSQMPAHSHSFNAGTVPPTTTTTAANNVMGKGAKQIYNNTTPAQPNAPLSALGLASAGGNQIHENRMPTLTMNWIIATQGIFPPRG
jgi:microcystin-dependent protein